MYNIDDKERFTLFHKILEANFFRFFQNEVTWWIFHTESTGRCGAMWRLLPGG